MDLSPARELGVFDKVAEIYRGAFSVRHFDTDRRLVGDRRFDSDARRRKAEGDIVNKVCNGLNSRSGLGKELVTGDSRTAGNAYDLCFYVKAFESFNKLGKFKGTETIAYVENVMALYDAICMICPR